MKTIRNLFLGGITLLSVIKVQAQIPNPSFEQWETKNFGITQYQEPKGWISNNIIFAFTKPVNLPIKKTTDAHTGSLALELTNVPDTSEYKQSAILISGTSNFITQEYDTKFKITKKPIALELYYKYFPVENDSFSVEIITYKDGESIGYGSLNGNKEIDQFEKLSIPIDYQIQNTIPDSASIIIRCGNEQQPIEGTKLIIDDLVFIDAPLSTNKIAKLTNNILVYPNPANTEMFVQLNDMNQQRALINMVNLNGQLVVSTELFNKTNKLDISTLPNGIYLVEVITDSGVSKHKVLVNN